MPTLSTNCFCLTAGCAGYHPFPVQRAAHLQGTGHDDGLN